MKGARTNACWICLPRIGIIKASLYFTCEGSLSERKIRQDHISQCSLHRGVQEPSRSIGNTEPVSAIVSYPMARRIGYVQEGDGAALWLHAIGSSPSQSGRSTYSESFAKRRDNHDMPSVDLIMLWSEAHWFSRFIAICQCKLKYWMYPHEQDYQWMQRVAECDSKRQVQNVLNDITIRTLPIGFILCWRQSGG